MISRHEIDHALTCAALGPDAEHVYVDDAARAWLRFLVDFDCDGSTFSVEIWAQDWPDAERRVQALRSSARVVGQVHVQRDAT